MVFIIKKFISQFLMPIPLVFELALAGWLLSCFSRYRRIGRSLTVCAVVLFFVCGYGVGAGRYLSSLERIYPPIELDNAGFAALQGAAIVILGQGLPEESDLPVRYQIGASFQQRLQEGMRLYRKIPKADLYISLAGAADNKIKEQFVDAFALEHGLRRAGIHLITSARDTSEEARYALEQVKTNRLVVVTSASHLPRAVKIFSKELKRRTSAYAVVPAGQEPADNPGGLAGYALVPAPCDYLYAARSASKPKMWALPLPSVDGFRVTQYALYEGLGNMYVDFVE
jgi:uncharacterized SAM-binding protein YcdF (DUF218 family)